MNDSAKEDPTAATSALCARCSVLRFHDDELLAPYIKRADDGTMSMRIDAADPPALPLDYRMIDDLPELPILTKNADEGCGFCSILRQEIRRLNIKEIGPVKITLCYESGGWQEGPPIGLGALVARVRWKNMTFLDKCRDSIFFYLETHSGKLQSIEHKSLTLTDTFRIDAVRSWLEIPPAVRSQVLCEENIRFMKESILNCETACHHSKLESHCPTRLIDVCPTLDDPTAVRLVERSEFSDGEIPRYAALSYCWGTASEAATQLRTKVATLASFKDGISRSEMSQVLRDGIEVCRSLCIRYLWIDAICIIQDDEEDWQRESRMMAHIYSNACVTLAATSSNSCHETFLGRNHGKVTVPFISRLKPGIMGHYDIRPLGFGIMDAWQLSEHSRSSWVARGWVVQEHMMSTRILLFGTRRIQFECGDSRGFEDQAVTTVRKHRDDDVFMIMRTLLEKAKASGLERSDIYEQWGILVDTLLCRLYTFDTDKLPALSGMAKVCAELTGDTCHDYLAGLWREDLPFGLLWFPICTWMEKYNINLQQLTDQLRQPSQYISPSWSPIRLNFLRIKNGIWGRFIRRADLITRCTINEARTMVEGENPWGRVQGGFVRIRGKFGDVPSELFHWTCSSEGFGLRYLRDTGRLVAYCQTDCWTHDELWPGDGLKLLLLGTSEASDSYLKAAHITRNNRQWNDSWHCYNAVHRNYGWKTRTIHPRGRIHRVPLYAARTPELWRYDENSDTSASTGSEEASEGDEQEAESIEDDRLSDGSSDDTGPIETLQKGTGSTEHGIVRPSPTKQLHMDPDSEGDSTSEASSTEEAVEGGHDPIEDSEAPSLHPPPPPPPPPHPNNATTTETYCPIYDYFDRIGNGWRENNEDAWGLLLAPALVEGKWIRVGAWRSVVGDGGGIRYFDKFETHEVEIV